MKKSIFSNANTNAVCFIEKRWTKINIYFVANIIYDYPKKIFSIFIPFLLILILDFKRKKDVLGKILKCNDYNCIMVNHTFIRVFAIEGNVEDYFNNLINLEKINEIMIGILLNGLMK